MHRFFKKFDPIRFLIEIVEIFISLDISIESFALF